MQMHDFLSEVGLGTERSRLEGTQINVERERVEKNAQRYFSQPYFFSQKKFTYRTIVKPFSMPF